MRTDSELTSTEIEKEVREHVGEIRDFYIHVGTFIFVNAFLVALNVITSPDYFWAVWPILGWGFGLAGHAVSVFGLFGIGGKEWEERKVRELMLQRQHSLTAADVQRLLQEEIGETSALPAAERDRMLQRIENLETIVTSREWDLLESGKPEGDLTLDSEESSSEEQAARLSRRVR